MCCRFRVSLVAAFLALVAAPVAAQRAAPEPPVPDDWRHGTTLTVSGGAAVDSTDVRPAVGAALGWELTPRLALEGCGVWIDRTGTQDAFNAAIKVRGSVRLNRITGFAEGGVGLFRFVTQPGEAMPSFYARRMTGGPAGQTFMDPTFQAGAGLAWFVSRHVSLQPAFEAVLVTRDAHNYVVGIAAMRLSYHFEDHPVTR